MKANFKTIIFILFVLFFTPICVFANSSENYQSNQIVDYGGNLSSSENYQLVDNIGNSDVFFEQDSKVTPVTPTPTSTASPKKPEIYPTAIPTQISEDVKDAHKRGLKEQILGFFSSIVENPIIRAIKTPVTVLVAALTLWASLVPVIMNLPMASPIASLFAWVLAIFKKKKNPWGKVYDSETGVGIPLVAVRLFDKEFNRLIKTEMTDNEGRFGFLVNPGKYYIKVLKKDFVFPSKIVHKDYHGQIIEIKKEGSILFDIPLDSNIISLTNRLSLLTKITNFLTYLRIPLLIVGTIISVAFVVTYSRTFDIIVLAIYIAIWAWEIYLQVSKSKTFGEVFDFTTRDSINLAIVRVFNSINNKLISTKVSDTNGRFRFLINQGDYYITGKKQGYKKYQSSPVIVAKQKVIVDDIALEVENNSKQIKILNQNDFKENVSPTLLDIAST